MNLSIMRTGSQTWSLLRHNYITALGGGVLAIAAIGATGTFESTGTAGVEKSSPPRSSFTAVEHVEPDVSVSFYLVSSQEQREALQVTLSEIAHDWFVAGIDASHVRTTILVTDTEEAKAEAVSAVFDAGEAWLSIGATFRVIDMQAP